MLLSNLLSFSKRSLYKPKKNIKVQIRLKKCITKNNKWSTIPVIWDALGWISLWGLRQKVCLCSTRGNSPGFVCRRWSLEHAISDSSVIFGVFRPGTSVVSRSKKTKELSFAIYNDSGWSVSHYWRCWKLNATYQVKLDDSTSRLTCASTRYASLKLRTKWRRLKFEFVFTNKDFFRNWKILYLKRHWVLHVRSKRPNFSIMHNCVAQGLTSIG